VQIARSAQALSGLRGAAVFPRVVHDEDSEVALTLKLTQVAEQLGDLARVVLIDPVQAHERIEDEHLRREPHDRVAQPRAIDLAVEAQRRCGDDVKRDILEPESAVSADADEAFLDDGRRVLGHVEQDRAGFVDVEEIERERLRSDREREIEGEPRLAALGRTAEDADARASPE
jgi:hypothetical protein